VGTVEQSGSCTAMGDRGSRPHLHLDAIATSRCCRCRVENRPLR